jgi:hypothetical protein
VLLVAVPVVSLAMRGTGAGGGAAGGVAVRSGGQEAGVAAGPTRLVEEDESLAAGAGQEAEEMGEMQESITDGGDAAGQTARPNGPVPDVVGMELTAACEELSAREYVGYVIRAVEEVGQRPLPGRKGYVGGPVNLTVSEPYPEDELRRLSGGRNPACLDATG